MSSKSAKKSSRRTQRSRSTGRAQIEEEHRAARAGRRSNRASLSPGRLRMAEEEVKRESKQSSTRLTKLPRSTRDRGSSNSRLSGRPLSSRMEGSVSPGSVGIDAPAFHSNASVASDAENIFTKNISAPPLTAHFDEPALRTRRPTVNPYEDSQSYADSEQTPAVEETEEGKIAIELHSSLATCSWQSFHEIFVALQAAPDKVAEILSIPDSEHQSTVLHTVVWKAPPGLIKFVLDSLIELGNADGTFMARDSDGNTPLHLCCGNLPVKENGMPDAGVLKRLAEAAPQALYLQNSHGDTPLHMLVSSPACCVSADDDEGAVVAEEAVSSLLDISSDVLLLRDSTEATPLHTAIGSGANELVLVKLLETAPDVAKMVDNRGMLPLHYAAGFGRTPFNFVELLVMTHPDAITAVTHNGDSPLHLLASNASVSMADLSTQRIDANRENMISVLMGASTDADDDDSDDEDGSKQKPLLISNAEKMNPLHCCALFDAPSQLSRFLMKNPLGPRAATKINDFGATPLHVACAQPAVAESVSQVASLGTAAAAAIQDRHKRKPLHVAAQNSHATADLIKVLSNLYPEASMERTQRGHLPLHLAAQSQASEAVIKALIAANPKAAESRNKSSNTPLHDAAKYRASAQVVNVLLQTYPDAVYIQNQYGNLPLHCATAYQAPSEVVKLLLEAWPDGAAMQNRNQDAPLHYAAAYTTSVEAVKTLIDAAPAAVLLLNSSGQSPLDRAHANNAPDEIVSLLEDSVEEWTKKASKDGWGIFEESFVSSSKGDF